MIAKNDIEILYNILNKCSCEELNAIKLVIESEIECRNQEVLTMFIHKDKEFKGYV